MEVAPKKKNEHANHRKRMRSRFFKYGISAFEDHEALEMLLYSAHKIKNTNVIAHDLLKTFGSLEKVLNATKDELCTVENVDNAAACHLMLVGQLINRVSSKPIKKNVCLSSSDVAGQFCIDYFKGLANEVFIVISLDCRRRVLNVDVIGEGDYNSVYVDVRKVVVAAMRNKADMVILAHNHPSDTVHPSDNDIALTNKIITVLEGIDIAVSDHIICNDHSYSSMEERGILTIPRGF